MGKPLFESEQTYSRGQIYSVVGGDRVSMFPIHQGRVACCCVLKIAHPDAPEVIMIAREGPMVESAKKCVSQSEAIPVFINPERYSAEWVYQGEFVAERYADNPAEIAPYVRKAGRMYIAGILLLKRISP